MSKLIYLDNAATTPVAEEVIKVVTEVSKNNFGNASSPHQLGRRIKDQIEQARAIIAKTISAYPEEIIFTSGGTESNNLAINGLVEANPNKKHIISSAIEHPAILEPLKKLEKKGYKIDLAPVNKEGIVDLEFIKSRLTKETLLVSIMHVNNEIGTIQPIEKIAKLCKEKQVLFHTDAVQSLGKIKINVGAGIDLLSASAHKINGPKGIGFLYVRKGIAIKSQILGGGQENNLRSGTENTAGILAFAKALQLKRNPKSVKSARDKLLKEILKIPYSSLNGSLKERIYNNLNISFYGIEGEGLLMLMDKAGICLSTGSACSSHKLEESHVLKAIATDPLCIHGSIRLSLDTLKPLSNKEIKFISNKIKESVMKLRAMSPFKMPGDETNFKFDEVCHND